MNESELLALIAEGESESVELKREIERAERLAREIVALANRRGGTILIGVDDNGTIAGITLRSGYEEWLMQVGTETIAPPLSLTYEIVPVQGQSVLVIYVPRGAFKPHAVKEGAHKRTVYLRHGVTTRVATPDEIGRLYQESGRVYFDQSPVWGTEFANLDLSKVSRYLRQVRGIDLRQLPIAPQQLLLNLHALVQQNGDLLATVAGIAIFGDEPARYLPQIGLRLARFKGTELRNDRIIDRQEINTTLPESIDMTAQFVARHSNMSARIESFKREDQPEYLPPVVREAVTNAVMHRDYSRSANVRVFLYDDRLEVRSPGRLPGSISLELLPFGEQETRNPTIAYFLRALGYGEGYGTGIATMIRRCEEARKPAPQFMEIGNEFIATIYSGTILGEERE